MDHSSDSPSKALRKFVGATLAPAISSAQVARYISEYRFFDAVAHDKPVVHSAKLEEAEPLFGRALSITPGGRGGFHMDRRGKQDHRPNWIFYETDLKLQAQKFMLDQKG